MNKNKELSKKCGKAMAKLAINVTKMNVNSNCLGPLHQPKLPNNAKKLRKF